MEHYKLIALLFSIVAFSSYVIYIYQEYDILPSISDSFYHLPDKLKVLFTLALWSFAIPVIFISQSNLMTIAGFSIMCVGVTPHFKNKLEGDFHVVFATGGILAGFLSLWLEHNLILPGILFLTVTGILTILKVKNKTWWIEISAFGLIVLGLFIDLIN